MAKSKDAKKNVKKEAALTPKEKKAAKLAKKAKRTQVAKNEIHKQKPPLKGGFCVCFVKL